MSYPIHKNPFSGKNSKPFTLVVKDEKRTMARQWKVQSVPIFKKDEHGRKIEFLGFRYINH